MSRPEQATLREIALEDSLRVAANPPLPEAQRVGGWGGICAKCMDGAIEPRFCKYYGEPDGCNSPTRGEYPVARNAAALREALADFVDNASCLHHCDIHRLHPQSTSCDGKFADGTDCPMKRECDAVFKGRAALSAPARNCDRFATAKEAQAAFNADYFGPTSFGFYEVNFIRWLFAPAEEDPAP